MFNKENFVTELKENRFTRAEWVLFASILAFMFIPSINQLIVDRLISGMGGDVLNIAGQIEWFDLFNEIVMAFLTVPLYFVFNKVRDDKERFKSRIMQTLVIGFIAYVVISAVIYVYANTLTSYMTAPPESIAYLRLETIGFIMSFIGSFLFVVLVVHGKFSYIVYMLIIKVVMLSLGNLYMIPREGVIGLALTNIFVNLLMSAVALYLVGREGLLTRSFSFDRETMHDWMFTGSFSGFQVLISNLVYMMVVMKMINDISEIGSYWLANNFIWGWLLVPATAFGEMVKRDYYRGYSRIWNYLMFMAVLAFVWLLTVPAWNFMFTDIIGAEDPQAVLSILYKLVPFYLSYIVCVVLQGTLTSVGRTDYLLICTIIVNIGYYGIVYGLFLSGVFTASLDFVICMFGGGMVVSMLANIVFYLRSRRNIPTEAETVSE